MNSTLLGRDVKVQANDLIRVDLAARILDVCERDRKLLLNFDTPITIAGVIYTYAIAIPRLSRDDLSVLTNKRVLGCAVTWVPKDRFDQSKPFDLTWWRGGAAAIADVALD